MQALVLCVALAATCGQPGGCADGMCGGYYWTSSGASPSYRHPLAWQWNYLYGCGSGGIHCQRCRRDWLGPEYDYRRAFDYPWLDPNRGWPPRPAYPAGATAISTYPPRGYPLRGYPLPGYLPPGYPAPDLQNLPEMIDAPPGELLPGELLEVPPGAASTGTRARVIRIRRADSQQSQ